MANTTKIDNNTVVQRLIELIDSFRINIKESHIETDTNDSNVLYLYFYPDKSKGLLEILRFQFFIRNSMQNDLFKFNISIGRAFIFKINKIDQFFEYINQLIIPKDLNKLFQGHDLDDFLRNYSDDELLSIVKYFPEKARAFMVNEYGKLFDENAVTELDECIKDKRYFEPLRYYMWNKFISLGSWHIYLEELSYGQSEDWAERVASGKPGRSLDDRYRCAFRSLIKRDWNSAMRNLRLNIRRRFANENDIFADKYFDLITGWTSNPLTEAQSYMSIYNVCINEGRSQAFADIFAKGMTSGNRAGDEAYWLNKAEKCNLQKD